MPNANGQHTDAENSRPMITAKNAGDALKQISSTSAQVIARSDPLKGDRGGNKQDAVTAPFPGGSL